MAKRKAAPEEVAAHNELPGVPPGASISLKIQLNEHLFLRDPQDSKLGRSILREGTLLIDELGIEDFTFKKLARRMGSTEASIYRYFANKHLLLVYLASFYWAWIRFRISVDTRNMDTPKEKIRTVIRILVDASRARPDVDFVDMEALFRIVIAESTKVYHTKLVDEENKQGFFLTYKALCRNIADIFLAYEPAYPYPRALASTLLEMTKDQIHFARHLPRLTDIKLADEDFTPVIELMEFLVFGQLDSVGLRRGGQ